MDTDREEVVEYKYGFARPSSLSLLLNLLAITTKPSLATMKSFQFSILAALAATQAMGHATFQQLWVNGEDQISLAHGTSKTPKLTCHTVPSVPVFPPPTAL